MSGSLKAKRSVIQSVVRTIDRWKSVGVAEVGHLDSWQRSQLGATVVAGSVSHAEDVADAIERRIWATPDVTVLSIDRDWWEAP